MEGLIAEAAKRGEVDLSLISIDSTTTRAHHDAAGMHLDEEVLTAREKAAAEAEKARSKGAAATNEPGRQPEAIPSGKNDGASGADADSAEGRPARTLQGRTDQPDPCRRRPEVPPAGVHPDRGTGRRQPAVHPRAGEVRVRGPVGRPRTRPDAVAGDKAYSSRGNRAHLRKRRIKAVIPKKKDQAANRKKSPQGGRPVSHDADLYKERNTVERLINKLKAWRGIATRYDKTSDNYLAGLHLRASMTWLRDPTRTIR